VADLERFVKAGELPYLRYELHWKGLVLLAIIAFILLMLWQLISTPLPGEEVFYLFAILAAVYLYPWLMKRLPYFKPQRRWRKEAEELAKEAARTWDRTLVLTSLSTDRMVIFPDSGESASFGKLQQEANLWRFAIRQPGRDEDHPGLAFGLDLRTDQVRQGARQRVWTLRVASIQFKPSWRGAILTYVLVIDQLEATISGPWPE